MHPEGQYILIHRTHGRDNMTLLIQGTWIEVERYLAQRDASVCPADHYEAYHLGFQVPVVGPESAKDVFRVS